MTKTPASSSESSALLPANNGTPKPSVRTAVAFTANVSLAILVLTILSVISMRSMGLIIKFLLILFLLLGWAYSLLCLYGLYLWCRGEVPLTNSNKDVDGKYIVTTTASTNDRTIEYFVWGSTKPNATVTVVCHGSNTTGKYFNQYLYPAKTMEAMNVKVISPSYPGHGGSDAQPFRDITDWPKDDLEPILLAEGVDTFMIQGSSYGTAHAMAAASYFSPDRCLAMGLNVPYLPENICREFDLHTDADYILSESSLSHPWILLPILSLLSLTYTQIAKGVGMIAEGPAAMEQIPAVIRALEADCRRSFLRGPIGQAYEMLNSSTNQQWPDPRDIQCQNVAIWYAEDDGACPPDHGEWLADVFTKKERKEKTCKTNIRHEKKGLGHFTYMDHASRDQGIMTETLLAMILDQQ
ncbi:Alpha beta hydrolase [Seminavis robusta]|uniref:Alpha beta hydrolase n=1 Tax=Seminavis robusta TaxID=568900 RepID=A0A9N8HC38_9STRA|nr:Alpha beta hydrolase [Seminavis robusta]|eukprot:Sro284_g108010.1 Alpha beta hydrolase (411) ;mRNA; f:77545-78777